MRLRVMPPMLLVRMTLVGALACLAALAQESPDKQLSNIHQLTSGGQNAEAYWSPDGARLIFQSTRGALQCDQIFIMNSDGSDQHMVSTGRGRTTCGYFLPDGKHIIYASTSPVTPARHPLIAAKATSGPSTRATTSLKPATTVVRSSA